MRPLSKSMRLSLEIATEKYESLVSNQTAYDHLQDRGINPESIKDFRLGFVGEPISGHEQYRGCLAIPGIGPNGVYSLRFRNLNSDGPKYLSITGAPTRLFNVRAIHTAGDVIAITEGELDAVILNQCGVPAIGVPGANNWKRHHSRMVAGFQKVFIFGDGDKAGEEFSKKVMDSVSSGIRMNMPSGHDVNSFFLAHGQEHLMKMMEEK
jgi:DNA primase